MSGGDRRISEASTVGLGAGAYNKKYVWIQAPNVSLGYPNHDKFHLRSLSPPPCKKTVRLPPLFKKNLHCFLVNHPKKKNKLIFIPIPWKFFNCTLGGPESLEAKNHRVALRAPTPSCYRNPKHQSSIRSRCCWNKYECLVELYLDHLSFPNEKLANGSSSCLRILLGRMYFEVVTVNNSTLSFKSHK